MAEIRLDIYIKKKLNISRQKAVELIHLSCVKVNGRVVIKPAYSVKENDIIDVVSTENVLKYVSRGGYKLEKAIEVFNIDLKNKVCIDIGASTGGFTDCMLQYGAKKVYAFDVGKNQLADKIRNDIRVVACEETDIRNVKLDEKAYFISCDVSFISIKHIIKKAEELFSADGQAVFLIKPQFEAGREFLNKNGIVKNPKVHKKVINDIITFIKEMGLFVNDISYSPIKGGDGNIEYIILVSRFDYNKSIDTESIIKSAHEGLKQL